MSGYGFLIKFVIDPLIRESKLNPDSVSVRIIRKVLKSQVKTN